MVEQEAKLDLVLLLGGSGTRMGINGNDNKALVEVAGKQIISRIKDKIDQYEKNYHKFSNKYVITNGKGLDRIMPILGEGYIYCYQSKSDGLLNAAYRAKPENKFLLHLGDQCYQQDLQDFITTDFKIAKVWLKRSDQYKYHNTAIMSADGDIKQFVEKPTNLSDKEGYVSTGIYLMDPSIFEFLPNLVVDQKGETNLADVLNQVINKFPYHSIQKSVMTGYWFDVGTPEITQQANNVLLGK